MRSQIDFQVKPSTPNEPKEKWYPMFENYVKKNPPKRNKKKVMYGGFRRYSTMRSGPPRSNATHGGLSL